MRNVAPPLILEKLEERRLLCGYHSDSASPPLVGSDSGHRIDIPWTSINADVLPDLKPISVSGAYDDFIDRTTLPGRTLIRFGTAFGNVGTAPLILEANIDQPNADGTQSVNQVMFSYESDGNSFEPIGQSEAGRFVYHQNHSHFHLQGYASYKLIHRIGHDGVGAEAKYSNGRPLDAGKIGFCIRNVINSFTVSTGVSSQSLAGYSATGQPPVDCGMQQGLHVGRADIYSANYDQQWIDVTGVEPGKYWLEVKIDANNVIRELDETNNVKRWRVTVPEPSGALVISPDRFEGSSHNDTIARAKDLGVTSRTTISGLTLHSGSDRDVFKFRPASSGTFSVSSISASGNVDLYVFNSSGTEIARSTLPDSGTGSALATDTATVNFVAGETYYVRTESFGGQLSENYSLKFSIAPRISINTSIGLARESTNKVGRMTVSRNGSVDHSLYVYYTISGTAQNGSDFVTLNGVIKFDVGTKSKSINIVPLLDQLAEGSESVVVRLKTSNAYKVDKNKREASVSIAD